MYRNGPNYFLFKRHERETVLLQLRHKNLEPAFGRTLKKSVHVLKGFNNAMNEGGLDRTGQDRKTSKANIVPQQMPRL